METSKKQLVEQFKINDPITIQVQQGQDTKIGKTSDGIICFFNKTNVSKLKIGSFIDCNIYQVKDSFLVVKEIKPPLSTIYSIGEVINVTIDIGEKNQPIAKAEDGTICFFNSNTIKPQSLASCTCEITQIKEKVLIIKMINVIQTAKQRETSLIAALVDKYKKY